jgi:subtilase family serine protease
LNQVNEMADESNNVSDAPLQVTLAPYADLVVSDVVAPAITIDDPASVTVTWTVHNQGTGVGQTTEWTDEVFASRDAILGNGDELLLAQFAHSAAVAVGEAYNRSETFLLPPAFQGRYTLYVQADADGQVFENGIEENNYAAASGFFDVMTLPYADLVVDSVTPETPAYSGQDLAITWVVRNQGIGLTNRYDWQDSLYLATAPDGGDRTYVASFDHVGFLAPGGTYTRTGHITLPDGIQGTYYAFLDTGGPFEFVYTENNSRISGPIEVRLTTPPDLVVSDIIAPDTAPEGSAIDVTWTVLNQGQGDASGSWVDRLFLRKFGETGVGAPIGTYTYQGPLQAGMSYTRREQVTLPNHVSDQFEILVVTDADRTVYEHAQENNNQSVDDTRIAVSVLPRPDLQMTSITGPAAVDAGGTASIDFTVINQGPVATRVPNWTDRVYLSLDDKITSDDIVVSSLSNGAALAPGEQYLSLSDTFEIPKRFRGTVYVLVMTDQGGVVDEWPNETNNVQIHPIYVNPWPFADLVVSDVVAPAQTFEGSEIEVRYTVTNLGSGATDRGEWTEQIWFTRDKNRPHPGLGDVLLKTLPYTGGTLERNAGYDRVVTVELPDSLLSGTYYIMPWVDPYALVLEDTLAVNVNPDDPNEVDNNNYKARAIDVIGVPVERRPDPFVQTVTAETFEYAGEEFTFSWTVGNLGPGAATGKWVDAVYLTDQPVFDEADPHKFLLGWFDPLKTLGPGETYTNTQALVLSPAAKGQYVHVKLAMDPVHPEDRDLTNNTGTAVTDVRDRIPDLVVNDISLPAVVYSGEKTRVRYTVTNTSDQPIWRHTQYWTDRIYLSKDPTFIPDPRRVILLAEVPQPNTGPLAGGATYTRDVEVTLPPGIGGDYYIYVFANVAGDSIPGTLPWPVLAGGGTADLDNPYGYPYDSYAYEYSLNNMAQDLLPVVYREPDLRVTSLLVPDTVGAGETVSVSFTVTNVGTRDTRESGWLDRIYLSRDPSLDERDILMSDESLSESPVSAEYERHGVLKVGQSYTASVPVTMPFDITGPFCILAYTDTDIGPTWDSPVSDISPRLVGLSPTEDAYQSARVREFQGEGNNLTAASVEVTPYNAPDLRVTALTAPERATRGQSFDLTYTVTNLGGPTPFQQRTWGDLIYLSRDAFLDLRADRFLTSVSHTDGLAAGGAYGVTRTLSIPTDMATEAYYVFVVTDPARYTATGDLFEGANERNNDRAGAVPMVIELPPPTDLVVTDILIPTEARVGEPVHFEWTVTNQSVDIPAAGTWTDSLFLSTDATWDISDRPLGRATFTGTLTPGASYTLTLDTALPPATPGQFRVVGRTDIFDQVYESVNEANNRTASADTVTVTVDELQIGVPLATHLNPAQERLYRITVPADQTLRISLRGADEKSANEIFVRHDAVPTSAAFDATYEGPLGSDLSALVPSTEPGTYYLLVRNFSAPPEGTNITLLAELLPLAITDVYTDAGGDSRHVTTTIRGAQFHPDAIVKLVRPGIAEYEPLDWKVVESSTIIATFDFSDAPHGLYDLSVINPTGDEAVIPYRFLVERAIEPEVTIGIGGPRVILAGDQATYSIALQNLANLDAPYTYFEVGVPQLNLNPYVYGLPYLEFFTNVRGTPEGATGTVNAQVPWVQLESITNTTGQLIASGYLFDEAADGFAGFSFNVITYPGLRALHDRAFEAFRQQMSLYFPDLDEHLAGGEGGLDAWWEAVKKEAEAIDPSYGAILDQIDFVGMYKESRSVPGKCQIPFIPFRFHVVASATTMTRKEFVGHQSQEAIELRQAILQSDSAPAPLLALAADEATWVNLYLASLEDAGLLRPEGSTPTARRRRSAPSSTSSASWQRWPRASCSGRPAQRSAAPPTCQAFSRRCANFMDMTRISWRRLRNGIQGKVLVSQVRYRSRLCRSSTTTILASRPPRILRRSASMCRGFALRIGGSGCQPISRSAAQLNRWAAKSSLRWTSASISRKRA